MLIESIVGSFYLRNRKASAKSIFSDAKLILKIVNLSILKSIDKYIFSDAKIMLKKVSVYLCLLKIAKTIFCDANFTSEKSTSDAT